MNNHDLLGVSADASTSEIKHAFREAAKELHPDLSDSPEAAEAFARIKEAHDALLKEAGKSRESTTVQSAAARAAAATATAAATVQTDAVDDAITKKIQELDDIVLYDSKKSFFTRHKESATVKQHRKKLKTNERRLRGLY